MSREADEPHLRMRRNFVFHVHPLRVSEHALNPWLTLGLGILTGVLFFLLCASGALLMIYYIPSTERAYDSMLDIQHAVAFGPFVRALHRWSAHGMVACVGLHLVRVAACAAYRGRTLNWFIGLALLASTLGLAYTGYLLPWDQRAYWAVTVSANLLDHFPWLGAPLKELFLGGERVGQAALIRFYTLHVFVLPVVLLALLGLHLWRIRKDGGLAGRPADDRLLPAWPHLLLREAILVLCALAVAGLFAALVDAPLGGRPDLHHPSNPDKAPWFFLWVQEMVSYSAPVGGVAFPSLAVLLLVVWPFADRGERATGRWLGAPRSRWLLGAVVLSAAAAFASLEWAYLAGEGCAGSHPDLLNPASGMLVLAAVAAAAAGWVDRSRRTALLAALGVTLVAVVGCILVGLCRGPDWIFYWPWEDWPLVG
ncbi:MAG: cytochrome b N-terminal domain-containing protein [Deltaproteobacteria bacterium]|nr:cytochrome b N-terminal domain-containing protein [Deltaproteobacteria bacterium]